MGIRWRSLVVPFVTTCLLLGCTGTDGAEGAGSSGSDELDVAEVDPAGSTTP